MLVYLDHNQVHYIQVVLLQAENNYNNYFVT